MKNSALNTLSLRTLLLTLTMAAAGGALGVGTPVGTSIQNTATLNYQDSLGGTRNKDSNTVTVKVRQVYAVSVETSAAETSIPLTRQFQAIAGNQRLISYTLQNAGNGPDTFGLSVVQSGSDDYDAVTAIYLDANNDGLPDGPAISSVSLNAVTDGSTGDRTNVLVEVTAPSGTPVGQTSRFALKAVSQGDTSRFDDQNYAQLSVSAAGQIALSETVNPTGGVNPGATLTYTVSGSVVGGAPVGAVSGVVTVDGTPRNGVLVTVPVTGASFVGVSASASSAGTQAPIYSVDNGATWSATPPVNPANVTNVALLVSGTAAFLPSGSTFSLSYTAAVPAGAAAGTLISSTATSVSDGNGDGDGTDSGEVVNAAPVSNTVNAVYAAVAGPFGFPGGNAAGSYTFGGYTIDRNLDTQTVSAAVTAGTTVSFKHTIQNTGNASENLSATLSGVPSGWTCTLQNVSASNTLSSYSNPITLAAGASIDIAVVCTVPITSGAVSNTDLTLTVTGGATPDTTIDRVAQVVPAGGALLGNSDGSAATPPSTASVTDAANPGQNATFPLELLNGGPVAESYTLSATVPGTVFYADTNCDGAPDGPAITTTPSVPSGANICLVAVVPVAAGASAGTSPVAFTATSTTEATRTTTVNDSLQSNAVLSGSFSPNGAQATIAGGSVTYTHTLTNTSNAPVTANLAAYTSAAGLVYSYSTDNLTFSGSLSVNIPAGGSTPIYVRVSVPAGTSGALTEAATINAVLSTTLAPTPTLTLSATDTTTVQSVSSSVVKSMALCTTADCTTVSTLNSGDAVSPGDIVRYTVVASNNGTGTLFGSYLTDAVPASTELVSVGGSAGVLYSVDDGQSWSASVPASLPLGHIWVGHDSDGNSTINASDGLNPNDSFTLILTVRVK